MGCDGGTIPRRDELVKLKKKPEQKDKVSELSFRWRHCALSQEPLKKPIVACGLGRLYNKDSIIQKLLDKSTVESVAHIKSLKDIKDLTLTPNPAFKDETEKGDNQVDRQTSPHICPISGLEMNGKFKFCFFWTCGCVMSERALKQFVEKVCVSCQKPFTDADIVIMNAVEEDLERMNKLREERSLAMKSKKQKNKKTAESTEKLAEIKDEKCETTTGTQNGQIPSTKSIKIEKPEATSGTHKNGQIPSTKNMKIEKPDGSSVAGSSKRSLEEIYDPSYKKVKSTYSVAKDAEASDVYKSLFTSHRDAKSHDKAHWVTFNPFYN